ncbi:Hspb1-Associated Protein 1 [Manis pentadactyla]|nr:Hspb1-Associated Protein 1 [Manis pentadactyla]
MRSLSLPKLTRRIYSLVEAARGRGLGEGERAGKAACSLPQPASSQPETGLLRMTAYSDVTQTPCTLLSTRSRCKCLCMIFFQNPSTQRHRRRGVRED